MAQYKVPKPSRDGFTEGLSNSFSRAKMDDGQYRPIHIFGSQPVKNKLTWKLSWEELQMFEGWVEYTLNGGVNWFDLQISPSLPSYSYHMVSAPEYTFDEPFNRWIVSVEVERKIIGPVVKPITYYPDWPESLEDPEKDGYSFSVPDHVTFGELQGGEPGVRRRFTDKLTSYNAKWIFDFEQYEIFKAFLTDDLAAGLAFFRAPFANGMGYSQVKARFASPPVATPLGTHWVVTAQLETTAAPLISQIMFELGGKLNFADSITLFDEITNILKTGEGRINDTLFLTDLMAQVKRPSDILTVLDAIFVEAGKGNADGLSLLEQLKLKIKRPFSENLAISDSLTWAYTKRRDDVINLLENIALASIYKRQTFDAVVSLTESISSISTFGRPLSDIITMSDTGSACWNDYIDPSYFAGDYFATCYTWGDLAEAIVIIDKIAYKLQRGLSDSVTVLDSEITWSLKRAINESITLTEAVNSQIAITRAPSENVDIADSGYALIQDYFTQDYFETQTYFGTKFQFLN